MTTASGQIDENLQVRTTALSEDGMGIKTDSNTRKVGIVSKYGIKKTEHFKQMQNDAVSLIVM
jgi:hypothetical protein